MKENTKTAIHAIALVFVMWFMGFISGRQTSSGPLKDLRQQAVERGYAEWRLTHAHDGTTEFRWIDPVGSKDASKH